MQTKITQRLLGIALLFSATFISATTHAQENEEGKQVKDTLILKSGARFVVGDKIQLGYGSDASKNFQFLFVSPYAFANAGMKLGSVWAKHTLTIKKIEFYGSKKAGKKFYLVVTGGDISNYWCAVDPALEQKEVIVNGINDAAASPAGVPSAGPSLADELKKLKDLHDSKSLTDKEYEAAKKKLLGL